jgi:hypothetical protein
MFERAREVVGGPNVEEIVGVALLGDDARARRVGKGLRPSCDVGVEAFGVCLKLLAKVRVERCEPVLTAGMLAYAGAMRLGLYSLLEGLFMLQYKF